MKRMTLIVLTIISANLSACDHRGNDVNTSGTEPPPPFISQKPSGLKSGEIPSDFYNGGPRGAACMGWSEYQSDELTSVWLSPNKSMLALPSSSNVGEGDQQCDFAIVGALQLSIANDEGERNLQLTDLRVVPASNNRSFCQAISQREILKNALPGLWSKRGDFDASIIKRFDSEKIIFKKVRQTDGLGNVFRKVWPSKDRVHNAEQKRKYCR